MKIRTWLFSCLIVVVVLGLGYRYTHAESEAKAVSSAIGVVSVRTVFETCKRNTEYRRQSQAEQTKILAELESLSKAIDSEKAGLKALKPGTDDYLNAMKDMLQKQANFEVQQEYYKQQISSKDQQYTEQLYKDILAATAKVAQQKQLDIVLEKDVVDLPAPNAQELLMAIRMQKVLYSGGAIDITEPVIAELNAMETSK